MVLLVFPILPNIAQKKYKDKTKGNKGEILHHIYIYELIKKGEPSWMQVPSKQISWKQ